MEFLVPSIALLAFAVICLLYAERQITRCHQLHLDLARLEGHCHHVEHELFLARLELRRLGVAATPDPFHGVPPTRTSESS